MCNIFQTQLRLVLLIATFGLTVSCLITNCPKGGKRAGGGNAATPDEHRCTPCGPRGEGVCLGRNMCCGNMIGCLTSSKHTETCRGTRRFRSSCIFELRKRPTCGEEGYCRAENLCCSKDFCMLDASCRSPHRPPEYGVSDLEFEAAKFSVEGGSAEAEEARDDARKSKDEFDPPLVAADYVS